MHWRDWIVSLVARAARHQPEPEPDGEMERLHEESLRLRREVDRQRRATDQALRRRAGILGQMGDELGDMAKRSREGGR